MNGNFENKFYDFFSKKENFEYAYDIYEKFKPLVIDRLYEEFWSSLQQKFDEYFQKYFVVEENGEWEFLIPKKEWKIFSAYVSWNSSDETIDYGIHFEKKNKTKIYKIIEDNGLFLNLKEDNNSDFYWFYREFDENFENLSSIKLLIPESRDELIQEYIHQFEKFIEKYNKEIVLIEKKLNEKNAR